jgi:hypothetical protein
MVARIARINSERPLALAALAVSLLAGLTVGAGLGVIGRLWK